MRSALRTVAIILAAGGFMSAAEIEPTKRFDGHWWSRAEPEERSGFLNGAGDCLISVAHKTWVSRSIEWAIPKITEYYRANAASSGVPVVEVWRAVLSSVPPETPRKGGEVFTNPHGYYDGEYWRESSESQKVGFLEGYLWCLRTQVEAPSETYSRPVSYYIKKIDAYVNDFKAHPGIFNQSIASTLSHFRDNPTPN
jgi:hypothetical protein